MKVVNILAAILIPVSAFAQVPPSIGHRLASAALARQPNTVLPQRTFVSAVAGSDVNTATNCALATPCRNFAAAIGVTSPGGEIVALDSGGFGQVTVDRAVAIIGPPGVYAAITAFSGTAIQVNAASDAIVVLRGLTLNGLGADNGIGTFGFGELVVENCRVSNFAAWGMGTSGPGAFRVSGSVFTNNAGGAIQVSAFNGPMFTEVISSEIDKNYYGITASDGAVVEVIDSAATNNVMAFSAFSGATVSCTRCAALHNGTGFDIFSDTASSSARLNDCAVASNITSVRTTDSVPFVSTVGSMGNNMIRGNLNALSVTLTPLTPK